MERLVQISTDQRTPPMTDPRITTIRECFDRLVDQDSFEEQHANAGRDALDSIEQELADTRAENERLREEMEVVLSYLGVGTTRPPEEAFEYFRRLHQIFTQARDTTND